MKSILFLILTVNLGFFLFATEGGSADSKALGIVDYNVPKLCIAGISKASAKCNITAIESDDPIDTPKKKPRKVAVEAMRTASARPAKRVITRSNSVDKTATNVRQKPQQLASLGKTPAIKTPLNTPKQPDKSKVQCFSMGPFIDRDDAFALHHRLDNLDVQSVMRTVKEKEQFWVYLQDRRSTTQTVSDLRKKGITSYKVITRKGKRDVVSLGRFDRHSRATRRYKKLASLGFTPKLVVQGSPGEQVWVDYLLRKGTSLSRKAKKAIKLAHAESYFHVQPCK